MHSIISNLKNIQNQLIAYDPKIIEKIKIVAVSKTFPMEKITPLIEHGHIHFGENKIQEAISKWSLVKNKHPKIKLHMIGKIQSNKAKYLLPLFDYIHSLDSLKVANLISNSQKKQKVRPKIFIQINIGNEQQKSGINFQNLKSFYNTCVKDLHLDIIGFMCLPPLNEKSSKYFKLMNEYRALYNLKELSMGMSSDYLQAIKYQSTFLRLGSCIFGSRG